ncbi:helix-turn-helix domain-containing protein [Kribbella qitaiheensis]
MRNRMLGLLRVHGPATATTLAERLGVNTGATSYHLRQLAEGRSGHRGRQPRQRPGPLVEIRTSGHGVRHEPSARRGAGAHPRLPARDRPGLRREHVPGHRQPADPDAGVA